MKKRSNEATFAYLDGMFDALEISSMTRQRLIQALHAIKGSTVDVEDLLEQTFVAFPDGGWYILNRDDLDALGVDYDFRTHFEEFKVAEQKDLYKEERNPNGKTEH